MWLHRSLVADRQILASGAGIHVGDDGGVIVIQHLPLAQAYVQKSCADAGAVPTETLMAMATSKIPMQRFASVVGRLMLTIITFPLVWSFRPDCREDSILVSDAGC
jgi:hypothetical protein